MITNIDKLSSLIDIMKDINLEKLKDLSGEEYRQLLINLTIKLMHNRVTPSNNFIMDASLQSMTNNCISFVASLDSINTDKMEDDLRYEPIRDLLQLRRELESLEIMAQLGDIEIQDVIKDRLVEISDRTQDDKHITSLDVMYTLKVVVYNLMNPEYNDNIKTLDKSNHFIDLLICTINAIISNTLGNIASVNNKHKVMEVIDFIDNSDQLESINNSYFNGIRLLSKNAIDNNINIHNILDSRSQTVRYLHIIKYIAEVEYNTNMTDEEIIELNRVLKKFSCLLEKTLY